MRADKVTVYSAKKPGADRLQGSKYVQSYVGTTYNLAKKYLEIGRKVLFSGTPCQIAGFMGYLGKDYDNLITVDIICHGVPNAKLFKDYIDLSNKKLNGKIMEFDFRNKEKGWGLNTKITFQTDKEVKKKHFYYIESSYYVHFIKSDTYRESCYSCKYACSHRPADFTIGDYWGIDKEHPEIIGKGKFSKELGISVISCNTQKAIDVLKSYSNILDLVPSTFEKAARHNEQLRHPSHPSSYRKKLFELYSMGGYEAVDKAFYKDYKFDIMKGRIKYLIPSPIKNVLKRIKKM